MKKYASAILTLGFLILFAWYGLTHPELFDSLKRVAIWSIVLIVVGRLVQIWSNGLFTKWTVEAFTDRLAFGEAFTVAVLTAIGNFFGPLLGGLGIRAVYLKKYHNLSYSKFTSTLIGYYQMMFIFNSLLAVIALIFLPRTGQTLAAGAFFLAWLVVFVGFTFMKLPAKSRLLFLRKNKVGAFLFKVLYDIEDGWQVMIKNKTLLYRMALLAICNLIALYFISLIEFKALAIPINLAGLGLYTALVQASLLLSITPGAVGLREAMLLVLATTIGLSNQEILQVAVLDRAIYFLMLGVLMLATRHSKLKRNLANTQP